MYQIDDSTAVAALPTPDPAGPPGYFTDGDAATQQPATVVPADFFNSVMLELLSVIQAANITPSKTAYNQVLLAIETLIQARSGDYLLDTGAANAYVVAPNPPLSSYPNGLTVKFRAAHANTGASTLNAGAGAVPLVRDDGTPLQSGDIGASSVVTATYDSTANAFLVNSIVISQIQGEINSVITAIQEGLYIYGPDTGTANAYTTAYLPAITTPVDGMTLEFGAAHANTGASTFSPNGLTASPILGGAHQPLQGGEIVAGSKVEVIWDAPLTSWVLLESTGGNIQTPAATQPLHAVNLAQAQALTAAASGSANSALYQLGYLL